MAARRVEELGWGETPWGEVSLRRRHDSVTQRVVLEVRLGEEFLMSSQFTTAERELARLGLAEVDGDGIRVMVAGLGLGYTAHTALEDDRVSSVAVVEALAPVIDWHRQQLVPDTRSLVDDPRVGLVHDDFFGLVRDHRWTEQVDALLVDIDHSPDHLLRADHADFYTLEGLRRAAAMITGRGCFGLWSDDPPDAAMTTLLGEVFEHARATVVTFANPVIGGESSSTVYVAREPRSQPESSARSTE